MINDQIVDPKAKYILNPGDRLVTYEAGGGGNGDPKRRDPERIRRDILFGYVSPASAERDYGKA